MTAGRTRKSVHTECFKTNDCQDKFHSSDRRVGKTEAEASVLSRQISHNQALSREAAASVCEDKFTVVTTPVGTTPPSRLLRFKTNTGQDAGEPQ